MGVLIYVYLSETLLGAYVLSNSKSVEIVQISLIILIMQSIFALY